MIEGRADLVIGAPESPSNAQGLSIETLTQIDWVFAVSPNHPLLQLDREATEEDIAAYRAVVVRDSSRQLPPQTRRVLDRQAAFKVTTMQQKIEAQMAGLGVGFLPRHRIEQSLRMGHLVTVPLTCPIDSTPVHMAWRSNNKGKALHWFIDWLINHFRENNFIEDHGLDNSNL